MTDTGNGNGSDRRKVTFNFGDALHVIQIAILLMSLGIMYEKFQIVQETTEKHSNSLDRIEHYLSSKDKDYWKDSRNSR